MDRFDLEDNISRMMDIDNELDDIIYKVGDCEEKPTEDEILNLLIGVKALNQSRYNRLWNSFENLVKQGIITTNETKQTA